MYMKYRREISWKTKCLILFRKIHVEFIIGTCFSKMVIRHRWIFNICIPIFLFDIKLLLDKFRLWEPFSKCRDIIINFQYVFRVHFAVAMDKILWSPEDELKQTCLECHWATVRNRFLTTLRIKYCFVCILYIVQILKIYEIKQSFISIVEFGVCWQFSPKNIVR